MKRIRLEYLVTSRYPRGTVFLVDDQHDTDDYGKIFAVREYKDGYFGLDEICSSGRTPTTYVGQDTLSSAITKTLVKIPDAEQLDNFKYGLILDYLFHHALVLREASVLGLELCFELQPVKPEDAVRPAIPMNQYLLFFREQRKEGEAARPVEYYITTSGKVKLLSLNGVDHTECYDTLQQAQTALCTPLTGR